MSSPTEFRRYDYYALLAFAFTAVASIAFQNLIWVSIALFLFLRLTRPGKINWPSNLFAAATILFLATFIIGALLGVNPSKSFETVHKYLTFLVIFPLGAMALSLLDVRKLLHFFIAGAWVCAVYGIGKHFLLNQDRIDSFSGDKMVFGGMLMASLLIVTFLLKSSPKNPWLWLSLAVIGTALIFTGTRGAWVGALAGSFFLMRGLSKRYLWGGVLILICLFFLLPSQYQDRIKSITDIHYSYTINMMDKADNGKIANASQPRLLIWASGLKMIRDFPLGVGQGNVEDVYPRYRIPTNDSEPTVPHLHDNFLQIAAQNGWLGFAVYLFWIFAFYHDALRFKPSGPEADQWNWMFLSVFTAIWVWGLTEYTFSHQFMNIQFFLLGLQTNLWLQKPQTN
jgi:O-antigen ligase